jgi:2-polyprenyl-3-methyl-5-hydroxy-6-metoxy-1,4-benzoquinol methylase
MTTQREAPDANALKERQVKIWTSGEYARIGNPISIMGEILCEAVDLRSGDRVLDVATGSGNTAISAARRFCEVTGMDLAPESIEHPAGAPKRRAWR